MAFLPSVLYYGCSSSTRYWQMHSIKARYSISRDRKLEYPQECCCSVYGGVPDLVKSCRIIQSNRIPDPTPSPEAQEGVESSTLNSTSNLYNEKPLAQRTPYNNSDLDQSELEGGQQTRNQSNKAHEELRISPPEYFDPVEPEDNPL